MFHHHCGNTSREKFGSRKMISLTGIRFFIEFSSILVLAFLCIMHEFTDVTLAKQFNIDHASNQASLDDVEQQASSSLYNHLLSTDDDQSAVTFTPESLDFGHQPISMPVIETVYIHNRHDESNIQMISISGNTEHFHCSFFEDKVVPVQSNTSFQVVFLARQEGLVNNTLYIHSSIGSFQYRVSAFGEASPFRVRPLIGARVPLNSSFASLIYVYNPFATPLQLTEMYTSGGGLHLELPNDESEAPSNLWKVPPYETRPVMKAHFVARIASNHTSYIRIRTNATDFQLMLPVEVEVSNSPGLYSPLDTLDFGVLRAKHDQPKLMPIQVINAAMKSINVQNIVVTPLSDGLTVEFDGPIKLPPRSSSPYHIANLVLDPSRFSCTGLCSGKILIKSKNNQYKLTIPFIVRIIQGELYFNGSLSHFFVNQCSTYSEQRILSVENRFDSPIIVHDITLPAEAKPYFKLTTEHPNTLPLILPVGVSFPLLKLEFTPSPQLSHFSTAFRLLTNLSHFDLPLYAYRGRLDLFIPNSVDQTKLDIGLVGLSEHKSLTFVIANHNPIAIRLNYWHCNLSGILVELVGTSQGNVTAISQRIEPSGLSRSEITLLQPNHFAVFRVHVDKISKEGVYNGLIMIKTPFETLNVPLILKVLRGSLSADKVILPKTFPGRMVTAFLNVKSNYTSQIKIKGAFIEPKDERFQIKLTDKLIKPDQDNKIAITFDATALCLQRLCYSALDVEKEVGHLWLLGTGLYSDTAYIDKELYKLLRNQWLLLGESDRNPAVNIRLQVDGFGSFTTEAQAQLHWPRLSNKLVIRFPSTRIGRTVTKDLMIENPADRSILVQAINVVDYPNSDVLLQLISNGIFHQQWPRADLESINADLRSGKNSPNLSTFYFVNTSSPVASSFLNSNSNRINDWLGVEPNSNSYTMLLPPGARQRLTVAFCPLFEGNVTSLLILRNNLTIVEVVMLRGEGGRGLLKIGTALPNLSNSKLMFEFSERNLERKCRNAMQKTDSPKAHLNSLVMKEKFKATNIGRMGLQIRHFLIDEMPCEGYGFHINRCEPVFLLPNQTFEMEIVYSPDFTQPTVTHELRIIVDDPMNSQNFKLVVNVPQKLLQSCLAALPRPVWENFIYYLLLSMALLVLLLSVIVAISDAHRITYNYSMQLLKVEKNKSCSVQSCNGTANNYDKSNNPDTYSKKSVDTNGVVVTANGNQNHSKQSQQQSSLTKVRNRKGSNHRNNANGNCNSIHRNKNSQHSNNRSESTKLEESRDNNNHHIHQLPQSALPPIESTSDLSTTTSVSSSNWSYVLRKKLLRQDSSSSEQSQPSSDNNSSTSSLKNIDKDGAEFSSRSGHKSNSQSMNGDLPSNGFSDNIQQSSNNKIAQTNTDRKQKPKEEKKVTEQNKNNKKNKAAKSGKPVQKLLEKTVTNQVDSTKSSSESLNFSTGTKFDLMEVIPKARSATLPLINDPKTSYNENMSISQSNIMPNLYENNRFETIENQIGNGQNGIRMKSCNNHNGNKLGRNLERNDSAYGSRNRNLDSGYLRHNDSHVSPPPGFTEHYNDRSKDIWDHPITTFDSELAMSMLVKQTEEFAANGNDKMGSHRFGSDNNRKFAGQSERNNKTSRLNDDKWEIGEWSNDLAKHAASVVNNNTNSNSKTVDDSKDYYYSHNHHHPQQQMVNSDANRHSRPYRDFDNRQSNMSNNSLNDYHNQQRNAYKHSANFRNSTSYGVVNPLSVGSASSSISKNSSLSSNSPGFSPVIGRPTPPPNVNNSLLLSGQHVPSRLPPVASNFSNMHSKFNEFSFPTKNNSPPIDLPFNGPFGSSKTNLDLDLSFLEQGSLRFPSPNGTGSASTTSSGLIQPSTLIGTSDNRPSLNAFLGETSEWNRHSLDGFPTSSSFISSPDSLAKQPASNIFNFENESVWTSTAASPSSLWSAAPITSSGVNSKSSFGFGSSLSDNIDKINSSWPSASSLSNGNNGNGLANNNQFAPGSGQEYAKFAKTTGNNSRIWSPFDYYDYSSSTNNIDLNNRQRQLPISATTTLPQTSISNNNNSNLSDITASAPIGFENTSTVLGLFGCKSPWSPLGTSPTETSSPIISTPTPPPLSSSSSSPQPPLPITVTSNAAANTTATNNNNSSALSPTISQSIITSIDPFNDRFSRNISPSLSTSTNFSSDPTLSSVSSGVSSSASSTNQADCSVDNTNSGANPN